MSFEGKKTVLTVDVLVVVNWQKIALIRRKKKPEMDKLVLPGGHVDADNVGSKNLPEQLRCPPDSSVVQAVIRECQEEINVQLRSEELEEWLWLDGIGRDPREFEPNEDRRISMCFIAHVREYQVAEAKAKSDARELHWVDIDSVTKDMLGFDHWRAIKKLQDEKQKRREFWRKNFGGTYEHFCLPQPLQAMIHGKDSVPTIFWAVALNLPCLRIGKSGHSINIKACPYCGKLLTSPIEE